MRTTITLEGDVAAKVQEESRKTGRSFMEVVNESLRAGLTQRHVVKLVAPFRVEPLSLGGPTGHPHDNIGDLLEEIESPQHR